VVARFGRDVSSKRNLRRFEPCLTERGGSLRSQSNYCESDSKYRGGLRLAVWGAELASAGLGLDLLSY